MLIKWSSNSLHRNLVCNNSGSDGRIVVPTGQTDLSQTPNQVLNSQKLGGDYLAAENPNTPGNYIQAPKTSIARFTAQLINNCYSF